MTTLTPPHPQPANPAPAPASPGRLSSLDAYRGFVMLLMMAEVLRLAQVAAAKPADPWWHFLAYQQTHVEWVGCSLHDLIQSSFSFLVGVALPFSIAGRAKRGQSRAQMIAHVAWRALALILLGVFLRSLDAPQTNWTLQDTLAQIGLGYVFLFLLGWRSTKEQWLAFALILVGCWAAFALYPLPGPNFDYAKVGVAKNWPHLMSGFSAHWNKNSNLGWAFDTWFLNLFPRQTPFLYNEFGSTTLNFIPTLATMILGLIAGGILRGPQAAWAKVKWLVGAGVIGLASGAALGWLGLCPVVKRIWTPSWTLYSGGWCLLLLAGFFALIEIRGWRRWSFPLVVVGTNSIAAYCMAHLLEHFIAKSLRTHLGSGIFKCCGAAYEVLLEGAAILLIYWLLLLWMHRRKIFLRI